MEITIEGNRPNLPLPISNGVIGRKFIQLRNREYIVDIYAHWSDGELVWTAYKWNGSSWPKIGCFTRAEENRFPKTIAKMASEFLESIESSSMLA